jgi:hypothetical protein
MIRESTKQLVKEAEEAFTSEESHFSRDYARYGMLQNLIDNVVEGCIDAVMNADLREITRTAYDKENYDGLRVRFSVAIGEKYGTN